MPVRPVPCTTLPERPGVLRRLPLLVTCIALLWATNSYGATVAVAIIRPTHPSPWVSETLIRLYGELLSIGFEVQIANLPSSVGSGDVELRAWLEEMAGERTVDAVVNIAGNPLSVTVWTADKGSGRFAPTRVDVEPSAANPTEQLSIQAIEVLRSTFLEMNLTTRARRASTTPTAPVAAAISTPRARLCFELGAAMLTSLDGVGPALLPTVRVDWDARSWLVIQTVLAGLGTQPSIKTDMYSASVAQSYALVGGRLRFRADQTVRPLVGLAVGLMRTSLEGHASSPGESRVVGQRSLLVETNAGAELALGRRYYLVGTLHAQVAAPYVAIHFGDTVVASTGRPTLIASLAFGAAL